MPCPSNYLRLHPTQFTGAFSTIGRTTKTGSKALLSNTQKQTQRGCQIEETKKYGPIKEQSNTPEKEINETEITNLTDAEFKTLVIRMLKELTEYSNSIKKAQEEMKITLSEIKKNLQGTSNRGDDTDIQNNDLEHKEEISIQREQQE